MNDQTIKRFVVRTAAAGLSTWAIDMAATQVGLPRIQADLDVSVTTSQWTAETSLPSINRCPVEAFVTTTLAAVDLKRVQR